MLLNILDHYGICTGIHTHTPALFMLMVSVYRTEAALGELLKGINEKDPLRVDFSAMVNIIILHSQSTGW